MTEKIKVDHLASQRATSLALVTMLSPHMWRSCIAVERYREQHLKTLPKAGIIYRLLWPIFDWGTEHKAPALVVLLAGIIIGVLGVGTLKDYMAWGEHSPIFESLICITCAIGWYLYRFECGGPKMWMSSVLTPNGRYFNYETGHFDFVPDYVVSLLKGIQSVLPDSRFMLQYTCRDPIVLCYDKDNEEFVPLIYDNRYGIELPHQ